MITFLSVLVFSTAFPTTELKTRGDCLLSGALGLKFMSSEAPSRSGQSSLDRQRELTLVHFSGVVKRVFGVSDTARSF